jgi:hypothetical protein
MVVTASTVVGGGLNVVTGSRVVVAGGDSGGVVTGSRVVVTGGVGSGVVVAVGDLGGGAVGGGVSRLVVGDGARASSVDDTAPTPVVVLRVVDLVGGTVAGGRSRVVVVARSANGSLVAVSVLVASIVVVGSVLVASIVVTGSMPAVVVDPSGRIVGSSCPHAADATATNPTSIEPAIQRKASRLVGMAQPPIRHVTPSKSPPTSARYHKMVSGARNHSARSVANNR